MKRALLFVVLAPFPIAIALGPLASCSGDTPIVREAEPDTKPCYTCTDVSVPDVLKCQAPLLLCGGQCTDVNGSDPLNCGGCNAPCPMNTPCVMGRCANTPGEIAAGGTMSVVSLLDGTLETFGADEAGQLGDDPTNFTSQCPNSICRYQAAPVNGVTGVKKVAAGYDHACAVQGDGKLLCWGNNSEGQLGHSPTTDKSCGGDAGPSFKCTWTPTEVTLPSKAIGVAAGKGFTCALLDTKDVYCWGTNTNSVTGRSAAGFDPTPNKLGGFSSDVEEISVASPLQATHGCGRRTDGSVMCWGKNDFGQLGQAMPSVSATPIAVQAITTAARVVTAENVSCVVLKNQDSMCWGSHARGTLGNASPIDGTPHPVPAKPQMRWGLTAGLFAGGATLFAKDTADKWYRWGVNVFGTYGDGTNTAATCGNDVCDPNTKEDAALFAYLSVSVANHTLGISKTGHLYAWGRNDVGQLGKAPGGSDVMCAGNVYCNLNPQLVNGL